MAKMWEENSSNGLVSRLSKKGAEIELEEPLELLANIKMNLGDVPEELASKDFYGKVIQCIGKDEQRYIVRFTSAPPRLPLISRRSDNMGPKECPQKTSDFILFR